MKIHLTAEQVVGLRDHLKKSMSSSGGNDPLLVEIFDLLTKNILSAIGGQEKAQHVRSDVKAEVFINADALELKEKLPQPTVEAASPEKRAEMARIWKLVEEHEQAKIDNLQRQLDAIRGGQFSKEFMLPDEEESADDFGYPRKGWKRPPSPHVPHKGKRRGHFK